MWQFLQLRCLWAAAHWRVLSYGVALSHERIHDSYEPKSPLDDTPRNRRWGSGEGSPGILSDFNEVRDRSGLHFYRESLENDSPSLPFYIKRKALSTLMTAGASPFPNRLLCIGCSSRLRSSF